MYETEKEALIVAMLEKFDCEKVQAYMDEVEWRWVTDLGNIHSTKTAVPSVERVRESVENRCRSVMEGESGYCSGGGLTATCTFDTSWKPQTLTLAMVKQRRADGDVEKAVVTL